MRKPKDPVQAKGYQVLQELDRRQKGLFKMLDQMAYNRNLPKPNCVGAYLAMLIEEADFSFCCDAAPSLRIENLRIENARSGRQAALRSMALDDYQMRTLADSAMYSAMLWRAASEVMALGIRPLTTWKEQP
jgi:hypothetical protein